MRDRSRPPSARGSSVQADWRAWLPEEKDQVFHKLVQELESSYAMFSVSLNEAIELRQMGRLTKSLSAIGMTSGLCRRLTEPLGGLLRALCEHAKHYGVIPNAVPLDPGNFRGQKGQRSARISSLLNRVLLTRRLQFLHKASTLGEMVEDLGQDFRFAADDLSGGMCINPGGMWEEVDTGHYDLNTCLREAVVLFKSFLMALPQDQLGAFQVTLCEQSVVGRTEAPARPVVIRHRRMTAIAGE